MVLSHILYVWIKRLKKPKHIFGSYFTPKKHLELYIEIIL